MTPRPTPAQLRAAAGRTIRDLIAPDLRVLFWKQLRIIGSTMASRSEFEDMLRVALRGELRPVIDQVLPLERAREAHERLESGEQFGKIVIRIAQ